MNDTTTESSSTRDIRTSFRHHPRENNLIKKKATSGVKKTPKISVANEHPKRSQKISEDDTKKTLITLFKQDTSKRVGDAMDKMHDEILIELAEEVFGVDASEGETFESLRDGYVDQLGEELEEEFEKRCGGDEGRR